MVQTPLKPDIIYPESDGEPMADNTKQFDWIVKIKENIESLYASNLDVFVAGNLLWYPIEGANNIKCAPDVMVAIGRPKGYRSSYMQWEEEGITPQVVFEIWSPSNTHAQLIEKFLFYLDYGVKEYYLYDPDQNELSGWQREGERLTPIKELDGWVSPQLKIKFELKPETIEIYHPDGTPFHTYTEVSEENKQLKEQRQRADRLAARLREMGIDPDEV